MTRDEARSLVQAFFKSFEADSPGLNEQGLGGMSIGPAELYFEHQDGPGVLRCLALVYKFAGVPKPEILQSFEEEGTLTDTGGGKVRYEAPSRGVYLVREYPAVVPAAAFEAELKRLMKASVVWKEERIEHVAARGNAKARASTPKGPYETT